MSAYKIKDRAEKKASIVVHSKQREMTQERRMDHREPTVKSSLLYSLSIPQGAHCKVLSALLPICSTAVRTSRQFYSMCERWNWSWSDGDEARLLKPHRNVHWVEEKYGAERSVFHRLILDTLSNCYMVSYIILHGIILQDTLLLYYGRIDSFGTNRTALWFKAHNRHTHSLCLTHTYTLFFALLHIYTDSWTNPVQTNVLYFPFVWVIFHIRIQIQRVLFYFSNIFTQFYQLCYVHVVKCGRLTVNESEGVRKVHWLSKTPFSRSAVYSQCRVHLLPL